MCGRRPLRQLVPAMLERGDRRTAHQMREMVCELGPLNRADGSARFNFSRSSVLAGVFGPREDRASGQDSAESNVVMHFGALAAGKQWDRGSEGRMRESLETLVERSQNPMCVIEVTVQPMLNDGAQFAASFNAAVAALIDAGVPLRFVAAGVCLALTADGTLLMDPTSEEEATAAAVLTFVIRPADGHVVSSLSSAPVAEDQYMEALSAAKAAASTIVTFIRMAVEQRVGREATCYGSQAV